MTATHTGKVEDGGSAFPVIPPVDDTGRTAVGYPYPEAGMTLRDWFAGQADISGIDVSDVRDLARALGIDASDQSPIGQLRYGAAVAAAMRYIFADAMLLARGSAS